MGLQARFNIHSSQSPTESPNIRPSFNDENDKYWQLVITELEQYETLKEEKRELQDFVGNLENYEEVLF